MLSEGSATGKITDYGLRLLDSGKMMCFVTFKIGEDLSTWSCGTESEKQRKFLVNMLKGMGWRKDAAWNFIDEIADGPSAKILDQEREFQLEIEANIRGENTYYNVAKVNTGVSGRMSRQAVKDRLGKPVNTDDIPF